MNEIHILDNNTIDKIAAGEVVERPVSIVKELVENSIDAGASIITIEIKEGGIKLIRVTDNGTGIDRSQIRNAFMSHATSKINSSDDLNRLSTLGFRGEALSSIAAVSRVEVTSRTEGDLEGVHFSIEGGRETGCESVGAPVGTTFIVRDIFFNTLPRLKFLKTATTEGNMIADLCEHIALSMPDISFQFISNGVTKFSTSGHGDLKEVIYRIYGKDTASNIRDIDSYDDELKIRLHGYLGLPVINRSNRSSEIFFINRRFIKSPLISRAVEEGYIEYLMQHKFPFCILNFDIDPAYVDVNVHPTKQEVRLSNEKEVSDFIVEEVARAMSAKEFLDDAAVMPEKHLVMPEKTRLPEMFEQERIQSEITTHSDKSDSSDITRDDAALVTSEGRSGVFDSDSKPSIDRSADFFIDFENDTYETKGGSIPADDMSAVDSGRSGNLTSPDMINQISLDPTDPERNEHESEAGVVITDYEQSSFADDEIILSKEARRKFRIIGQVFLTYWLIEYDDKLMLMDQHAAHEKVNFERFMKRLNEKKEIPSQFIAPPEMLTLNNREMQVFEENKEYLEQLGFAAEVFGEHEIAIRSVPMDLYGQSASDLLGEIISDLLNMKRGQTPDSIRTRIATQACKASVKGNNRMDVREVEELLDEMLTLDNPYNCPHGRPTVIMMSKTELDKRFHRIV